MKLIRWIWEVTRFIGSDPYKNRLDEMTLADVMLMVERGTLTFREYERVVQCFTLAKGITE